MELTKEQRLILYNQYLILSKLDPEQADNWEQKAEIVSSGYTRLYEDELAKGIGPEVSKPVCEEVAEVLEMYRGLHAAAGVTFEGFDGNNETEHYAYAQFMIQELGRWAEFKNSDLNSHAERLARYRRMLQVWNRRSDKTRLSKDEAEHILNAGNT
jgi:uncharacterized protein YfbU (UPF0304 family)